MHDPSHPSDGANVAAALDSEETAPPAPAVNNGAINNINNAVPSANNPAPDPPPPDGAEVQANNGNDANEEANDEWIEEGDLGGAPHPVNIEPARIADAIRAAKVISPSQYYDESSESALSSGEEEDEAVRKDEEDTGPGPGHQGSPNVMQAELEAEADEDQDSEESNVVDSDKQEVTYGVVEPSNLEYNHRFKAQELIRRLVSSHVPGATRDIVEMKRKLTHELQLHGWDDGFELNADFLQRLDPKLPEMVSEELIHVIKQDVLTISLKEHNPENVKHFDGFFNIPFFDEHPDVQSLGTTISQDLPNFPKAISCFSRVLHHCHKNDMDEIDWTYFTNTFSKEFDLFTLPQNWPNIPSKDGTLPAAVFDKNLFPKDKTSFESYERRYGKLNGWTEFVKLQNCLYVMLGMTRVLYEYSDPIRMFQYNGSIPPTNIGAVQTELLQRSNDKVSFNITSPQMSSSTLTFPLFVH
jgi:hypothetical protein